MANHRSTRDVFEDHLQLRVQGDLETDLARNYSADIILICEFAVFRGRDAVRASADRLGLQLPGAHFEFTTREVADEYAFLVWKATSEKFRVEHGADSFAIRDGRIVMQTIYYDLVEH
jgi:hypothetical protein